MSQCDRRLFILGVVTNACQLACHVRVDCVCVRVGIQYMWKLSGWAVSRNILEYELADLPLYNMLLGDHEDMYVRS